MNGTSTPGWNLGGWLGGVLGGTIWMFLVAAEIFVTRGALEYGLIVSLLALAGVATGFYIWRQREMLSPAAGAIILLGVLYPATLAAFAVRHLAGIETFSLKRMWLFITLLFVFLAMQFHWLGKRGGR